MTDISKHEKAALGVIETINDPDRLRAMIENARKKGSSVVESAAFQRLCFVQPSAKPGTLEHDVWQSIHALEQMLFEERGKNVRLSRTRQKIARDGEAKTVADLTLRDTPSEGYFQLVERGFPELLFESLVLRHPEVFDENVKAAAERRLKIMGINLHLDV